MHYDQITIRVGIKQQIVMNKPILNSRAMSVTNCNSPKEVKHIVKGPMASHQPSTAVSDSSPKQFNSVYSILQAHFPQVAANLPRSPVTPTNFEEVLGRMLREIRSFMAKELGDMEGDYRSLEMEVRLLRDSKDQAINKNRLLQNEIAALSSKIKSKQLDCYTKNQQIFSAKQKIQAMEKQLVLKNIEIKNLYDQYQGYKEDCTAEIQAQERINQTLRIENKKLKNQVKRTGHKINQLEAELEMAHLESEQDMSRDRSMNLPQRNPVKLSYLQPYSEQNRRQPQPYYPHYQPQPHAQKVLPRNRSFSVSHRSPNISRVQKVAPSTEELVDEVRELRENQSALLDRLAERDKIIEGLENSLSTSVIQ